MDTWLIFHDFVTSDGGTENITSRALLDLTFIPLDRISRKIRISYTVDGVTTGAFGFWKGKEESSKKIF